MKNKKIFGIILALIMVLSFVIACNEVPNFYDVTFSMNGIEEVENSTSSQSVKEDGVAVKPSVEPSKIGKVFLGWFKDSEGVTEFDFSTLITENTTIYAKWMDTNKYLENLSYVEYNNFRGNDGISDAKTGISDVELKWTAKVTDGWSSGWPIEVGDYIYASSDNAINKISKKDGSIVKKQELTANIGFFSSITYGDGKIFVPIAGGIIEAFDSDTLAPLWISKMPYDKNGVAIESLQALSSITYHEGYIYMGVTNGNAKSGAFFCISTKDENLELGNEEKDFTWIFNPKDKNETDSGGFYWSAGAIVGDYIFFAGEGGVLYSHHLTDNAKDEKGITIFKDSFILEGTAQAVRSTLFYDASLGRIYATTRAGFVHTIKVNLDGTINKADGSYKSIFVSNNITSSPTGYRGRLYVGGGGMGASATFSVLNSETLEIIYTLAIGTQSSPMITTAYATAENNYKVYIYVTKSVGTPTNPDGMYVIEDYQGKTADDNSTKFIESPKAQYNTSSVMISKDGRIYYKNDTGLIFAYGGKSSDGAIDANAFTATDVINAINKLPNADELKAYDKNDVLRANYRYLMLPSAEKANVNNLEKLENNLKAL